MTSVRDDAFAGLLTRHRLAPDSPFRVHSFGEDPAVVERILGLIRSGEKRATFTLPWLVDAGLAEPAVVGGLCVAVDAAGRPVLLTRTTAVRTLPYEAIGPAETALDGPALRDTAAWRRVHWPYFAHRLQAAGLDARGDMPVTVECFSVVGD